MTEMVLNHPKLDVHKVGKKGFSALSAAITNCDSELYDLIEKSSLYSNTADEEMHILHLAIETAGETVPFTPVGAGVAKYVKTAKLSDNSSLPLQTTATVLNGQPISDVYDFFLPLSNWPLCPMPRLSFGKATASSIKVKNVSAAGNIDPSDFESKERKIFEIIRKILDKKMKKEKTLYYNFVKDGNSPIMSAAKALFQPERLCTILLELPPTLIDLKLTDGSGNNALLLAIESNNQSVAHILLTELSKDCNRFDVNAKNDDGNDALTLALQKSMIDFASRMLKNSKINVNGKNEKGMSPLMTSLTLKHLTIAKTLLRHPNINLFDIDDTGKSILMYAAESGDFEVFQSIFSRIPKNIKNNATDLTYCNHCPSSTCGPTNIKLSGDIASRGAAAACNRCSQYLDYSLAFSCPTCEYHQCVQCFESSKSDSKFIDATLYAFAMNISKGGSRYKNIADYKQLFFCHTHKEDAKILNHIRHLNIPELMREKPDEILNFLLFSQSSKKKIFEKLEYLETYTAIPGRKMRDFISLKVCADRFNQLNAKDLNNKNTLYYAAMSRSVELVTFLINQPEMIVTESLLNDVILKSNVVDLDVVTSLFLGSEKLKLASIGKRLIELCKLGFHHSIRCLITSGGSPDKKKVVHLTYQDPVTKLTPLITAIKHFNVDAVELILDLYPHPRDSTINMQCSESRTTALSEALNLNVNKQNKKLQIAIINRLLQSRGVDCVNVQKENTALMLAIKKRNDQAVEALVRLHDYVSLYTLSVDHTLGFDKKDFQGDTALHLMIEHSSPIEHIRKLISLTQKVDVINDKGLTPLGLAINNGLDYGVKILLENGATIDFGQRSSYISVAITNHEESIESRNLNGLKRNFEFPDENILTLLLVNQAARKHYLAPLTEEALNLLFEISKKKSGTYFYTTSENWAELLKISDVRERYFKVLESHIIPKFKIDSGKNSSKTKLAIVDRFFLALLHSMRKEDRIACDACHYKDPSRDPLIDGVCNTIIKDFQIFVKVPLIHKAGCTRTSTLTIKSNETIADIITKIWEKHYPEKEKEFSNKTLITHMGKLLKDNLTVLDYNIGVGHTLEVKLSNLRYQTHESYIGSAEMRTFILTPAYYDVIISAVSLFMADSTISEAVFENLTKKELLNWFLMVLNISLEQLSGSGSAKLVATSGLGTKESPLILGISRCKVGLVIGLRGQVICDIMKMTGTKISVNCCFPEGVDSQASISGTPDQVERAVELVSKVVSNGPTSAKHVASLLLKQRIECFLFGM